MAYKAVKQINNGRGGMLVTFLADEVADIASVPTNVAIGSQLTCLEDKKRYILSTTREWIEQ